MPTFPYYENPQGWEPSQQIEEGILLARLDSFFAVIAPENQSEIGSYQEYKRLLADRLTWMIRQWAEDLQEPLEAVYQMIRQRLIADRVPDFGMPRPGQETPENWATAITESPWLRTIWNQEIDPEYPLVLAKDSEASETVQYQNLEEWLIFFGKQD